MKTREAAGNDAEAQTAGITTS